MKSRNELVLIIFLSALPFAIPEAVFGADPVRMPATGEGSTAPHAARGIIIISPTNGQVLDSRNNVPLEYYVEPGATRGRIHLYIDGGRPIADHYVTHCPCRIALPRLVPGEHVVTLKEAVPGRAVVVESSVTFTVL